MTQQVTQKLTRACQSLGMRQRRYKLERGHLYLVGARNGCGAA